jgi:hypothetical protein
MPIEGTLQKYNVTLSHVLAWAGHTGANSFSSTKPGHRSMA